MRTGLLVILALGLLAPRVRADVEEFTNAQAWHNATGSRFSTIDFTGFADGTPINNQYGGIGVTFTNPSFTFASAFFTNDGWGLHSPVGVHVHFDDLQDWIAVAYSGAVKFQLLREGQLIYTSTYFDPGDFGQFAGLVSDVSFDEAYLFRETGDGGTFIDDLYWGASVPAPGGLVLFAIGVARIRRRRRS